MVRRKALEMSKMTAAQLVDWQHYLTHDELRLIKETALRLPPDPLCVGIGAGAGTITLGVLEERTDVLYFSVDILTNEREVTTNEHLRLQEAGFANTGHVIRVWGDSKVVGKRWRFPIDFLIIDGDHSEIGIAGDLYWWVRHVKHGGYVAIHDYGSEKWPFVKRVVDAYDYDWVKLELADSMVLFSV